MSTAYFYKLGFLTACADRGLGPDEAEALAARVLAERHAKAALLLPTAVGAVRGLGTAAVRAGVNKTAGALGVVAGLAGAPVWLAGQALRGAGNAGAAAGLGIGRVLYGDPEKKLNPGRSETDLAAHHERLARVQAMTAELKRRKAELIQTPGLFA